MSLPDIKHISCVIIVKNAGLTIENTLASLVNFQEVILYDNGSTDQTIAIAQSFSNVKLVYGEFFGFGETKNKAATFATQPWILSLDADETLTAAFIQSLLAIQLDEQCVYQMLRTNFYREQEIKYCWKKEKIVRLYHRQVTGFNANKVHEFVISEHLKVCELSGLVHHYPYHGISDFMIKSNRYSSLFAEENLGKKHSSPAKALFNAWFTFIKKYIIKRGFLDGSAGLIISFTHMSTNFFKYMKLYEANKALAAKKSSVDQP